MKATPVSDLFLVTCAYDEGMYESSFRLVRAPSRLDVARLILRDPWQWQNFLQTASLLEDVVRGGARYYEEPRQISPETLLEWIDRTHVDGDSSAQIAILPVREIVDGSAA